MSNPIKTDGLIQGQTEVEIAKYGPFLAHEHISRQIQLPVNYGQDRIVAMTRDPWWIFVYWEITPQKEKALKEQMERQGEHFAKSMLRIYDITGVGNFSGTNAHSHFDIPLKDMTRNWYVDIGFPGKTWCVEIGMVSQEGSFYTLVRSNFVHTPRFGMSDILDAAWMTKEEEYWWLFGVSGGFDVGKSSLEMKKLMQKRLAEWISSGGIITFASQILQQKK